MTNTKAWIVLGIAGILLISVGYIYGHHTPKNSSYGAIGTNAIENYVSAILYNEGYYSLLPITTTGLLTTGSMTTGAATFSGDVAVNGGTLTVTTTANATSTVTGGCIQTYATSSASVVKILFNSNSSMASSSINGGTVQGFVVWGFGTCPNL